MKTNPSRKPKIKNKNAITSSPMPEPFTIYSPFVIWQLCTITPCCTVERKNSNRGSFQFTFRSPFTMRGCAAAPTPLNEKSLLRRWARRGYGALGRNGAKPLMSLSPILLRRQNGRANCLQTQYTNERACWDYVHRKWRKSPEEAVVVR